VRIPLVKGRTESRAKERLNAAGFKVKVVRARSPQEQGTVIAQKPARGKAAPGKTITITVSSGGASSQAGGGGTSDGTDDAAARAFAEHKSGIQLTGEGSVTRVLADDNDGSRHQRFIMQLASGQTLLVAHNIDIAPRVPSLDAGDSVAFKGIYEWNSEGGTVHWTHHDPSGDHAAGWLKHSGSTYQ
jgi:beta-lactam-binding protein with PASTA domain